MANTCVPTVAGIEAAGATPVLVDVDERTFTLDPGELADATTPRTRAIVPVHLYGQCADMGAVSAFAREHGLVLVEDAAQAHGAALRRPSGRDARRRGRVQLLSDEEPRGASATAGRSSRTTPPSRAAVRELRSFGERGEGAAVRRGSNSRLDPLQAAVLSVKLPRLDAWNGRRRELADRYLDELPHVSSFLSRRTARTTSAICSSSGHAPATRSRRSSPGRVWDARALRSRRARAPRVCRARAPGTARAQRAARARGAQPAALSRADRRRGPGSRGRGRAALRA